MGRDAQLARQRLWNLLEGARCGSPRAVVERLTAVQGQEFGPALWSIAQRLGPDVRERDLLEAFDRGELLRTHALRPTWHLLTPADIRWVLAATAPRVQAGNAHWYRQLDLDDTVRGRCRELIGEMLRGGVHLTRQDIRRGLADGGIEASGQRLAYVMMDAEQEALVCSGPRQGKQHTYALLEERAPHARQLDHDDAVIELLRRYLRWHGPATRKDLQAWASLRVTDLRPAFDALADELTYEEHDGRTYWFVAPLSEPPDPPAPVHLLQPYDEYVMGYRDSRYVIDLARHHDSLHPDVLLDHPVLIDGQLGGSWKRTLGPERVTVEVALHTPADDRVAAALHRAIDDHARYLELHGELVIRGARP